jgi:hypothetical protein
MKVRTALQGMVAADGASALERIRLREIEVAALRGRVAARAQALVRYLASRWRVTPAKNRSGIP